jgi:deoxyribonuclease-4
MRIGRHMPLGAQPLRALRLARDLGCEAVQIFVTNPRGWRVPTERPAAEEAFRATVRTLDLGPIVVHASYLINLASPRDDFFAASVDLLRATLQRASRVGASSVVLHIGSHMGSGVEQGLARLAEGLRRTLDGMPSDTMLLLENDVGAGGELGARFEHIAAVLTQVSAFSTGLGVCLDTAHLWGAGFDIGTAEGATATLEHFDMTVGLARVPVIHLNDTKVKLGSHRDIHARLGEGIIGAPGLHALLQHSALAQASVLLETPIQERSPGKPDWAHDASHLRQAYVLAGRVPPPSPLLTVTTAPATADATESSPGQVQPPAASRQPAPAKSSVVSSRRRAP